jgi:hypothetical protein
MLAHRLDHRCTGICGEPRSSATAPSPMLDLQRSASHRLPAGRIFSQCRSASSVRVQDRGAGTFRLYLAGAHTADLMPYIGITAIDSLIRPLSKETDLSRSYYEVRYPAEVLASTGRSGNRIQLDSTAPPEGEKNLADRLSLSHAAELRERRATEYRRRLICPKSENKPFESGPMRSGNRTGARKAGVWRTGLRPKPKSATNRWSLSGSKTSLLNPDALEL